MFIPPSFKVGGSLRCSFLPPSKWEALTGVCAVLWPSAPLERQNIIDLSLQGSR